MQDPPIVAVATPPGIGAIAVIRTSGAESIELVARRFSRPQALLAAAGHNMVHGTFCDLAGAPIDDVLIAVFRAPRSYTGEDSVEIHAHGGAAVVQRLMRELHSIGFDAADPGEFTRRAFLNGKLDLTQAEAINEVIRAQTATAGAMAARRLTGALGEAVDSLRAELVEVLAQLAVQLDYGEDEVDDLPLDLGRAWAVLDRVGSLCDTHTAARVFDRGARVVITGETNVGKSSLFNRLCGTERALVSEAHGTTRDYIECTIQIDGLPITLVDTAGLRAGGGSVERAGIDRTHRLIESADLVIEVLDAGAPARRDDRLVVRNKIDLPARGDRSSGAWRSDERAPIQTSAATGAGIEQLRAAILDALLPNAAVSEGVSIASDRQAAALEDARGALSRFVTQGERSAPADILAFELQQAIAYLGIVTGAERDAELLDVVFSSFCVGK